MAYGSHEMHNETVENYQRGFIEGLDWALKMEFALEDNLITKQEYRELLKAKITEIESEIDE